MAKIYNSSHSLLSPKRESLTEIIGISQKALDKQIAKLKKNGLLKRIGADKGGRLEVLK